MNLDFPQRTLHGVALVWILCTMVVRIARDVIRGIFSVYEHTAVGVSHEEVLNEGQNDGETSRWRSERQSRQSLDKCSNQRC